MAQRRDQGLKALMPVEKALVQLLASAQKTQETITLPLDLALGCVLAEPIVSGYHVPPEDNSAMDGYALRVADWKDVDQVWEVSQRIAAGPNSKNKEQQVLKPSTVARIFTGAELPAGADAVVMQENTQICEANAGIRILQAVNIGDNVRPKGQDIQQGVEILAAGERISPQAAGLIASVGYDEVTVYKPLSVAVFSTGNELVEPGTEPQPGQIFNSNRYTLTAMLEAMGMEFIDLGIVPDDFDATCDALRRAAEEADIILCSGGVSAGEEDHVRVALESLGQLELWKLAIKPGKPFTYGSVLGKPFLGLPGNPVAVFVGFCILVWPYLLKTQGCNHYRHHSYRFSAKFSWPPGKRQEYLRARLILDGPEPEIEIFNNQSSGVLSSAVWCQGLAVVPVGEGVNPQDKVEYIPLDQFFTV